MEEEDFSAESERVNKAVSQARAKFLNEWISQSLRKNVRELEENHANYTLDQLDTIDKLEKQQTHLKEKALVNKNDIVERENQLCRISETIEQMLMETEGLRKQKGNTRETIESLKKHLKKEKEYLSSRDEATQSKLVELKKASDWFHSRMGLEFKRTPDSKLQVIFTCIDRDQPSKPFFFSVKIDEAAGTYIVSDCDPVVKDLNVLSEKLNQTNDFRRFIITMRSRFKQLV